MRSKPQSLALSARFVAALHEDTAGRPMQWHSIGSIGARSGTRDGKQLEQAGVKAAAARGPAHGRAGPQRVSYAGRAEGGEMRKPLAIFRP
jgi:hypothetical protein